MAMPPLLTIRDLAISFEREGSCHNVVEGLNLSIHAGQTLALVGESGCGKSVTALAIMGLLPRPPARIERGTIDFQGRNLLALSPAELRQVRGRDIAMIFQEPMTSLNPVFTIGDQLIEAVRLHRRVKPREAMDIAIKALGEVGITNPVDRMKQFPHEFSGGMRQRVMIAMALVCQPKLILADEPTTALDVTIQAQVLALLRELQRQRNLALLLITHDLGVVADHADVVCVMYAGRAVEYASVERLFDSPLHPYTRALFESRVSLAEPRRRLNTIAQSMDGSNWQQKRGADPTFWWPDRAAWNSAEYALIEVKPEHWVGCCEPRGQSIVSSRPPDIASFHRDAIDVS